MSRQPSALTDTVPHAEAPAAGLTLVERLRRGDVAAGQEFFRAQYPGIYRYLLWLTENPETAEDLAQETFLRAWRHLGTLDERAPPGAWLHRIAHREFLRYLRDRRAHASLEVVAEPAAPGGTAWTEAVELREVIRKLPAAEAEVVVLHYLQGYDCREIAGIVGAPVSTVKYRLATARAHLERALAEGDLLFLNEPGAPMQRWSWLPLEQMRALEARLTAPATEARRGSPDGAGSEEPMERREFLRQAAVGAAGMMLAESDKEIVDDRLTQKVTLALKATALADVCAHLTKETGVPLSAARSVADEKVTLFCKALPLREVMRQLSRPFGYTWIRAATNDEQRMTNDQQPTTRTTPISPAGGARSGARSSAAGGRSSFVAYRYELEQDLRSQLLEEELRTRDRNAALLALDQEMGRYRGYLGLTPEEARARAATARDGEKELLTKLGGKPWGALQLYSRLTPADLAALREGQTVTFSVAPQPGERLLPPEMAKSVLEPWSDWRMLVRDGRMKHGIAAELPEGLPPAVVPEAHAVVELRLKHDELGQITLEGGTGYTYSNHDPHGIQSGVSIITSTLATGANPAVGNPNNRAANAGLARDPALRQVVTDRGPRSARPASATVTGRSTAASSPAPAATAGDAEEKVTSAEVLEALHRATGLPVVGDYYTCYYNRERVTVDGMPLFDALNRLGEVMHLRWTRADGWLQFRSASYYDDRVKEVPNRLLARWAASRAEHGTLTVEDLVAIAQLSEPQLDSSRMAEGARRGFGLAEWDLARFRQTRPCLRYLAGLTPAQRQQAQTPDGLPFTQMSLTQQQALLAFLLSPAWNADRVQSQLARLPQGTLRMVYTVLGGYQWSPPPPAGNEGWRKYLPPPVRERRREAALAAARRIDPAATDAQIVPSALSLTVQYDVAERPLLLIRGEPVRIHIVTPDPSGNGFGHMHSGD